MPSRKHSNSPRKRSKQAKTPKNIPAPLLEIDQTPILKKALTRCRRLRNELHKKQDALKHFEEEDQPAYEKWLNTNFGAELTKLRELRQQVSDWEFICEHLNACEFWMPDKLPEVHKELMQRLKDGTLHAFEPPRPEGTKNKEQFNEGDGESDDPFEDIFDDIFDDVFGERGPFSEDSDFEHGEGPLSSGQQRASTPIDSEAAARKALYRKLAKQLHPDHSKLEEAIRERRWNELQTAYDARDLAALQRIEAVCDMEVDGLSIKLGLARLRDLAAYHQSHLQPIRQALKETKRHPAFGFNPQKPGSALQEVAFELEAHHNELDQHITRLRHFVDELREEFEELTQEPKDDENEAEEDTHDFWDDYNKWRDEELRQQAKDRGEPQTKERKSDNVPF